MDKNELAKFFEQMRIDLRNDLKTEIEQQTSVLKNAITEIREQQDKQYQDLKSENENLKIALEKQKEIVSAMNRLNNVVIYGIPENTREDRDTLVNKIKIAFTENLKIVINNSDINWVRRLGKPHKNPRPILLSLTTNLKKWQILESGPKLKGSDLYLSDDLSPEERQKRKYLNDVRKLEISKGAKCQWKSGKLIINGELKSFDDLKKKYGDHVPAIPTEEHQDDNHVPENGESMRKRKREEKKPPKTATKSKANHIRCNLDNFFRPRADSLPATPSSDSAFITEKQSNAHRPNESEDNSSKQV